MKTGAEHTMASWCLIDPRHASGRRMAAQFMLSSATGAKSKSVVGGLGNGLGNCVWCACTSARNRSEKGSMSVVYCGNTCNAAVSVGCLHSRQVGPKAITAKATLSKRKARQNKVVFIVRRSAGGSA